MTETRRRFDQDFRDGAIRIVEETGRPIVRVARELGVNAGTLANWVNMARQRRRVGNDGLGEDELVRLRKENAELQMRCDVLKRGLTLWVQDSTTR
ncbi:transposase [Streptosporangium album]|uniref:Transposase n=1 Tax=Streptosporangium album TaxID=47479 RepID=A0A7W7WBT1_9ACTN|nr:transposase [Streptosporangium album]MBB4941892.1 transposase [Streptosporangium album]